QNPGPSVAGVAAAAPAPPLGAAAEPVFVRAGTLASTLKRLHAHLEAGSLQAVLPQTIAHRLVPVGDAGRGALEQVRAMVEATPLP
ncbi:MAG: hypothetical protein E7K47_21405, partial [Acidovorax sp.]|nr:hypothetical protein [Acidovorax sp.]